MCEKTTCIIPKIRNKKNLNKLYKKHAGRWHDRILQRNSKTSDFPFLHKKVTSCDVTICKVCVFYFLN